jgi:hypothetical protein
MNDRSGYKYGEEGKCYPYAAGNERSRKAAKRKAMMQGAAIESSKARASGKSGYAVKEYGDSINDMVDHVRMAFEKRFMPTGDMMMSMPYCHAMDIFEDHVIGKEGDKYYYVGMDMEGEHIVFDDREDWEEMQLSYQPVSEMAQEVIVRETLVGQFRGDFPDVPIAEGVNLDELRVRDPNPVFVTLPIVPEVGAVSANGLLYDEALVNSIQEQINTRRPGGSFGHLKDVDRDSAFPIPEALWVGATRQGNTLWAKSYIRPGAAREYVLDLKAVNGFIATSIYGKGKSEPVRAGVRRLNPFKLESLDYAPPDRAALRHGALPQVTAEMQTSAPASPVAEGEVDMDREQIIAELTANDIPATVREQIVAEAVQPHVAQLTTIRETLGLDAEADLAAVIAEMQRKAVEEMQAAVQRHIDELVSEIKIESVRGIVADLVQAHKPQTLEDADAVYATVKESANVKRMLTAQVREMTGPPAVVASKVRGRNLEDTPENRAAAIAATGISI